MNKLISFLMLVFVVNFANAQIVCNTNKPISIDVSSSVSIAPNSCWGDIDEYKTETCCDVTYTIYSVECSNGNTKYFYYFPKIDCSGTCAWNSEGYYQWINLSTDTYLDTKDRTTALEMICGCH